MIAIKVIEKDKFITNGKQMIKLDAITNYLSSNYGEDYSIHFWINGEKRMGWDFETKNERDHCLEWIGNFFDIQEWCPAEGG